MNTTTGSISPVIIVATTTSVIATLTMKSRGRRSASSASPSLGVTPRGAGTSALATRRLMPSRRSSRTPSHQETTKTKTRPTT
jgi:hypothetical protein